MYSVLIVDDYSSLVHSVAKMINDSDLHIDNIYKAGSAIEALDIIARNKVHLVITDIRMPGMSGLEFIEKVRAGMPEMKCVLLSGYADFEYARTAIEHKAHKYLLKPVNEEELIETIQEVFNVLDKDRIGVQEVNHKNYVFNENLPMLKARYLYELLQNGDLSSDSKARKLKSLGIPFCRGDKFSLMLVDSGDTEVTNPDTYSISLFEYAVINIAEEVWGDQFHVWCCKDAYGYLVIVIGLIHDRSYANDIFETIKQYGFNMQQYVRQFLKLELTVSAVEGTGKFPVDLPDVYRTALDVIKQSQKEGEFLVSSLQEQRCAASDNKAPLLVDWIGEEYVKRMNGKPFRSVRHFENWASGMVRIIQSKYASEQAAEGKYNLIDEIHLYIENNLSKDVSLQTIADHVKLHPVYLSKIYKEETGKNLIEYITDYRMQKAAQLLRDSQLKIFEITFTLGYQTPHYFSKMFKEYYGVTPQQYRDK